MQIMTMTPIFILQVADMNLNSNDPAYRDRFYINDGKGNFTLDSTAIPANFTSKFCVRAADYDKDGIWIFLLQAG